MLGERCAEAEVRFRSKSSRYLQAQRVMTASAVGQQTPRQLAPPDLGSLSIPPSASRERETQLNKRIKELEEDVKVLKVENESQVRSSVTWEMCTRVLILPRNK